MLKSSAWFLIIVRIERIHEISDSGQKYLSFSTVLPCSWAHFALRRMARSLSGQRSKPATYSVVQKVRFAVRSDYDKLFSCWFLTLFHPIMSNFMLSFWKLYKIISK